MGVAGREETDAARIRRRLEILQILTHRPGPSPPHRDLGELAFDLFPEAVGMGSRNTGPVGELSGGGRSVEVQKALDG
ncbi:MAG: hypothetical protein M3088_05320, partial [Actinomycetota bacterium]|nr:hypothetical protein [Actinomycetota bacterium]